MLIVKKILVLAALLVTHCVWSQSVATYRFNNSLDATLSSFPALEFVGTKGNFVQEKVSLIKGNESYVYTFPNSSGLVFKNHDMEKFITDSYTIEMYFRYTDGELLIYNQLLGEQVKDRQGEYVHLAVSRDAQTQRVIVYLDGLKSLEFFDTQNQLAMNENSNITFFAQEGVITSGGAVSLIRIYNYFMDQQKAEAAFASFKLVKK